MDTLADPMSGLFHDHSPEFRAEVDRICRAGGMKHVSMHYTAGCSESETTPQAVADQFLKIEAWLKADRARPLEERLYDEYQQLFDAMRHILDYAAEAGGRVSLKDEDWLEDFRNPYRQKLTDIMMKADMALIHCNLIRNRRK